MANEPESISYINLGDNIDHPIDAVTVGEKSASDLLNKDGLVTSINGSSDDEHYPSAKCVHDIIYGAGGSPTPSHNYSQDYLTFDILSDGDIAWFYNENGMFDSEEKEIEYSKNNGDWIPITSSDGNTIISVQTGDSIRFRGNNSTYRFNSFNDKRGILTTAGFNVSGNIMSLIYGDNFVGQTILTDLETFYPLFNRCSGLVSSENLILPATTLSDYCYSSMFSGCINLTSAPVLSTTTLSVGCYSGMFEFCTSLTTAPELPATTLAEECYYGMFEYCTNLTTASELPATTLSDYCYQSMFSGCTSLTTAPELPATTLTEACYMAMFMGCTNLTTAPELPATTLDTACYKQMFEECVNLTTAPELPATTLDTACYSRMFFNCEKLNYIKCLATDISVWQCIDDWVNNVSSTGTFVKDSNTSWNTGTSGIPSGWTVQNNS